MVQSLRQVVFVLALTLVATVPGAAQPAFQVADIVTGPTAAPLSPFGPRFSDRTFAEVDGTVFFWGDDGLHGAELWRSDGTEAGTVLVKDVCPGICSSSPDNLVILGNEVYFSTSGLGVWRSDGTAAGTVQISALRAVDLIELDGEFLFTSFNTLWASDGTAAGTVLVRSFPEAQFPVFLGTAGDLAFLLIESSTVGREVWKTDGTAAGTGLVEDINPGTGGSLQFTNSERFPALGGRLFFRAFSPEAGSTLWVTDGTEAGTHAVPNADYPNELIVRGNEVFFSTWTGIWKSDGTTAEPIAVHGSDWEPGGLTLAGNLIYFMAKDSSFGRELWRTDGTAAGTERVTDLAPGAQDGLSYQHPYFFTGVGDRLVFYTHAGPAGEEPWATDGTAAGTTLLGDLNPGPAGSLRAEYSRSDQGIVSGGRWFFGAYTHPTGWALWTTDGTAAGTQLVRPFQMWSSLRNPLFTDHADTLFLALEEGFQEAALWKSDGSTAGTTRLTFFGGGLYSDGDMISWNGHVYSRAAGLWQSDGTEAGTLNISTWAPGATLFLTPTEPELFLLQHSSLFPDHAIDLWKTDGTLPGTQSLARFYSAVGRPVAFRGGVALAISDFFSTSDLWLSDGTAAGTSPLGLSAYLAVYQPLTAAGDRLFFWASGAEGPDSIDYEPWVSDGTLAGTRLLRDIRPGAESSQRRSENAPAAALGHRWFFLADDGISGEELWVSDGTTPGTRRLRDIRPGAEPARIESLVAGLGRVWFSADDGVHGRELWMSDGTEAGTRMVRDIVPGTGGSWPQELAVIGHILLFSAFDPVHGVELWRTDGTETGTVRMLDIAPGLLPSSPMEITASGPYLYFAANDGTTGFEPWALDRTLLGGFLTATKTVSGQPVPGGMLTYTIAVSNVGAGPHPDNPGDELVDVLPAGLALVGASADTGTVTVDLPARRVAWNGALPPGGTATVTIEATVTASRGNVLRNQASLSFDATGDGVHESGAVSAPADVLVTSGSLSFYTVAPCRLLDTRGTAPLASGAVQTVVVAGSCGIPADAEAVAANLTVVNPGAPGFFRIWPAGAPIPGTSNLNFAAGAVRANNATLALSGAGAIDIQAVLSGSSLQAHLVMDVSGYYRAEE